MVKDRIVEGLEILTLVGGLFILLFAVLFVFMLFSGRKSKLYEAIIKFISENYLLFGFVVSLIATAGSLFYSEIMGFEPCILCWYQRIFMYPQPILFLIAMKKMNRAIITNTLVFSAVGAVIAAYHYLSQIGAIDSTFCNLVGYSATCSQYFSVSFGYITIPMMALTAFLLIIIFNISVSVLRS